MITQTRRKPFGTRTSLAGALAGAVLIVSMGVAVPGASALGNSPFCKTIYTWKPINPPTSVTTASYHAWAKAYLPIYEKLASEAPNATTKKLLNELVVILKYEASSKSLGILQAYVVKNRAQYTSGVKALANAIISCAK